MSESVNMLAVSVGNTRTRIGAFDDSTLVDTATLRNDKLEELQSSLSDALGRVSDRPGFAVLMASVNSDAAKRIEVHLRDALDQEVLRVERDVPIPIGRQLDREAIVGEDRLLNAAAAYDVLQQAVVVVDAGTAMTVDFVDGAGTFHGGAILPGGQVMLDALNRRTAQLPEVEFSPPLEPMGHNTLEAMKSGVFHGMRGAARELVERFAEAAGQYPMVVATGGDGPLLFHEYDLVDRVVPDLTLMGLAVALRRAQAREAAGE